MAGICWVPTKCQALGLGPVSLNSYHSTLGSIALLSFSLQKRKLRHRPLKWLAQDCMVRKRPRFWNQDWMSLEPEVQTQVIMPAHAEVQSLDPGSLLRNHDHWTGWYKVTDFDASLVSPIAEPTPPVYQQSKRMRHLLLLRHSRWIHME